MPIPIVTVRQMREWETATWAAGRTEQEVIRRVGEIVARRALELTRPGDRILVLAGQRHNSDDAREAVPHLIDREIQLINVIDADEVIQELEAGLAQHPALVIDGLFGIGLNRPLSAGWIALI